jgi:hypothetical protein
MRKVKAVELRSDGSPESSADAAAKPEFVRAVLRAKC